MNTFRIVADGLAWAYDSSSAWSWGYAFQGSYGGGAKRDGVITFGGLRDNVEWANMDVQAVRFWVKFGDAGSANVGGKILSVYAGAKNSPAGTGASMRGDGVCYVNTATQAFNTSEVITFDSGTNSAYLSYWKAWLENTASTSLVLYINESSSSGSWSGNYLVVENAGMEIDYEVKTSGGSVSPSPVTIGQVATLTISPISTGGALTHQVIWAMNGTTYSIANVAQGVRTASLTVPAAWLSNIPSGATTAQATCTLTTIEDGTARGSRVIPFTVQLPASYAPVINSFSVERIASHVDDQGYTVWEPSLTGQKVWVSLSLYINRDSGSNPGTARIDYYPEDDESAVTTKALTWSSNALTYTNSRMLITADIDLAKSWVFVLTATNGHSTARSTVRIGMSWAPLHIAGSGYGVGVGMFSDGTSADPKFEVAWPAHLNGGADIPGLNSYSMDEMASVYLSKGVATGGLWYNGGEIWRSVFTGQTSSQGEISVGTLPNLPTMALNVRGCIVTNDGLIRPLPFQSYGGLGWSASAVVSQSDGSVKLYLGESYALVSSASSPLRYYLIVEYVKQT